MRSQTRQLKEVNRRLARRRASDSVLPQEILLSARDSQRLLKDLSSPPRPNERLKKAAARYKRSVGNNR